ncbi:Uncharacterised protein [Chlamydia trachomatis]|nr:Uncharacterised protein [Chlamydia trachomatis]
MVLSSTGKHVIKHLKLVIITLTIFLVQFQLNPSGSHIPISSFKKENGIWYAVSIIIVCL